MARPRTFESDFRLFFGRGLAILLPTIVTLWILYQAFTFLLTNVAEPINKGLRLTTVWAMPYFVTEARAPAWFQVSDEQVQQRLNQLSPLPADPVQRRARINQLGPATERLIRREKLRDYWQSQWYLQFVGLIIAILLIYLAGLLLGNFFGRQIYVRIERLIQAVPGFKQVYPHVKQVVELVLGEKAMAFNTVVLVEYPCPGIWTLGFLTGESMTAMDEAAGGESVSVFIPTSPTPFTGFTINMLREKVRVVDIPVDQALRFVITGGVLVPEKGTTGTKAKPLEPGTLAVIPARRNEQPAEEPAEDESEGAS